MNQITRFSVCRSSSSLLRKNPFTRWSYSKPMSSSFSSSLISNNNYPSSSNLLRRVFISNPYHPPPQIPGNHVRKFSGEAAAECKFDKDYLSNEIWDIDCARSCAHGDVEMRIGPPLDAVKILADKLDAFREKLGYDSEKAYPDHLKKFRKEIDDLEYYSEMVVAYGEFVAAGGSRSWHPFHGRYKMLMKGGKKSRSIKNRKILASLQQMKVRSNMMKRLMKEYELRQNQNLNQQ